jgi:hypothetical protein
MIMMMMMMMKINMFKFVFAVCVLVFENIFLMRMFGLNRESDRGLQKIT